jgi:RNA-directed DNA polymerase
MENETPTLAAAHTSHGGAKGRSPYTNACQHLGKDYVVTMDVRSFYPHVRHYMVYRLFHHELGFGREVASLLTRLTTLHSELPQGSPTSLAIANLLLRDVVDQPVSVAAREVRVTISRYVDDFGISGDKRAKTLINEIARALSRRRLPVYRKSTKFQATPKLKIMPRTGRQIVTGLIVNSASGASVPREYRERVRAAIFQAATLTAPTERQRAEKSIQGKIRYVARTNPGAARSLKRYFDEIQQR